MRILFLTLILILAAPLSGRSQEAQQPNLKTLFQQKLEQSFEQHPDSIGIILHVEAPDIGLSWSAAVGNDGKGSGKQLNSAQPVLIASNTKPYVAASVLRLVEMDKLALEDEIKQHLTVETTQLFEGDGYKFDRITIKHLLSHSSGIADYVDDAYFDFVDQNPGHKWEKIDQLRRSAEVGEPLFEPGTDHKYGDVNYLLLTEIIEQKTDQPFHQAIPNLLKFGNLGLKHTWFEGLETRPESTPPLAHQYATTRGWDSHDFNPSWDLYGGGGIASNVREAAVFMQSLFNHRIVGDKKLLSQMHQRVFPKEKSNYCLGVSNIQLDGFQVYYHGGWWGTDVAYCPEANCSVALFVLEKDKRHELASLSIDVLKTICNLKVESTQAAKPK